MFWVDFCVEDFRSEWGLQSTAKTLASHSCPELHLCKQPPGLEGASANAALSEEEAARIWSLAKSPWFSPGMTEAPRQAQGQIAPPCSHALQLPSTAQLGFFSSTFFPLSASWLRYFNGSFLPVKKLQCAHIPENLAQVINTQPG